MEKKSLIKFDETDFELLSSEKELSEINGGKSLLASALEMLGIEIENNGNCHGCNPGCK